MRQSVSNWGNGRSYPDIVSVIKLSDLYSVSLDELLKEDKKMINHLDKATNTVASRRKLIRLIEAGSYLLIRTFSMIVFRAFYGAVFWIGTVNDAAISYGYPIVVFYIVLPISAAVILAYIAEDGSSGRLKWLRACLVSRSAQIAQQIFRQTTAIFRRRTLCTHYAFGKTLKKNCLSMTENMPARCVLRDTKQALIAPVFGLTFLLADFMPFGAAWLSTFENVTFSDVIAVCEFHRIIIGTGASAVGMCIGILIKRSKLKKQTE